MAAPAQNANAFTEQVPDASQAPVARTLPVTCEAYLTKIEACIARLGDTSDAGYQLKQAIDQARREWLHVNDQTSLGDMCEQSLAGFARSASDVGCP